MPQELKNRIERVRKELGITGKNRKERQMDLDISNIVMSGHFEDFDTSEETVMELYKIGLGLITARESIDNLLKRKGLL
jgi:hypothetical protein